MRSPGILLEISGNCRSITMLRMAPMVFGQIIRPKTIIAVTKITPVSENSIKAKYRHAANQTAQSVGFKRKGMEALNELSQKPR